MDFIKDQSGRHLLHIAQMIDIPDYVKQANVVADEINSLPITCFADQVNKEFPLNTPAHTFLSYSYAKSAGLQDTRTLTRLKQAAAKWGIAKDLETLDTAFGQVKQAAAPTPKRFAIMLDFAEGIEKSATTIKGVQGFYPLNNIDEIQDSAVALDNDKSQLPLSLYVTGAREIVKAAHENQMENRQLPARILLYGTEHFPDFEHVSREADRREMITGDSVYREITKAASENPEQRHMDDYAKLWELADASNGIKYTNSIPDPYRIFNVGLSKQAYEVALNQHAVVAGAVVPVDALASVDMAVITKTFTKEAATTLAGIIKMAKEASSGAELTAAISDLAKGVQQKLLKTVLLATE